MISTFNCSQDCNIWLTTEQHCPVSFILYPVKCFDIVGRASERASGPLKLSDEELAWLYVWSKVQYCLHMVQPMLLLSQNPMISCLIKMQNGFNFLVLAYSGCPGKDSITQVFVYIFVYFSPQNIWTHSRNIY